MKHAVKHIHFVGVGGAGMSGIARILLARGVQVSGSDRRDTPTLLALRALAAAQLDALAQIDERMRLPGADTPSRAAARIVLRAAEGQGRGLGIGAGPL